MSTRPVARETIQLPAALANVISMYAHGGSEVPTLKLASVQRVQCIESASGRAPRGEVLVADSGQATLTLDGHFAERDDSSGTRFEVELSDGSIVTTKHAYVTSQRTSLSAGNPAKMTTELELTEWQWSTKAQPIAWVATLRGADFKQAYNLCIQGHGKRSFDSLRLEGNAAWHLTRKGAHGKRTCLVVLAANEKEIGRARLWHDFAALEFLFGTPLRLDLLVGVNEKNEPVAAYGASFGYRFRPHANHEPPLPDDRAGAWMAVAFPLVVRELANPQPNPVTIATCGYVDSTVGHIDGQYLFAQVALEALADRLTPDKKPVVKDVAAWEAWVKSLRDALKEHAADESAVDVLAVKLRDASRPTTSRLVQQVLRRMNIEPPEDGISEIEGRNGVAHTLSMTGGQPYDIERDVRRVRIVRTLLAATVVRHVGYRGALAGWDLDEQGWRKPIDWFPASDIATTEARRIYEATSIDQEASEGSVTT
jgi:hypothetical protein